MLFTSGEKPRAWVGADPDQGSVSVGESCPSRRRTGPGDCAVLCLAVKGPWPRFRSLPSDRCYVCGPTSIPLQV